MGLVVWLPLNGNLENQGVGTVTTSGTPTYKTGKIGASAYNIKSRLSLTCPQLANLKTFSVCFWGMSESSDTLTGNWQDIMGFNDLSSSNTGGTFRWESGYSGQAGIHWHDNSTNALTAGSAKHITIHDTWCHCCVVFDYEKGKVYTYTNGSLIATHDHAGGSFNTSGTFYLGQANAIEGRLNDVRIYNHALSAAEVHEISQGLVLHYKLDDTYMESSTFLTSTINTTAYNSSNGKYGYNNTSNLARTEGMFQGKQCIKISTITAGQNAQPYSYFSNLYTSNGTNSPAYKALSFDYYTTCPTTTWLNIYKLGSGTGTATWKTTSATKGTRTGTYTNSSNSILVQPNEWNRVEVVFHGTVDADAQWGYCINGPTHTSNTDYYFLFANIQLEQNDHVTGQGQEMHNPIITDSSGYGNNGTITGNITINSSTPRYSMSTKFPDSACSIGIGNLSTIAPEGIFTFNIWFKKITGEWSSKTWETILGGPGGFEFEGKLAGSQNAYVHPYSWGGGSTSSPNSYSIAYTLDTWHMVTMVRTTANTQFYLDGELKVTGSAGSIPSGNYFIGAWNSATQQNYRGYFSDARIYCTALSAADVKQLYEMGAKVDNKQNLHTYEIKETNNNLLAGKVWTSAYGQRNPLTNPFINFNSNGEYQFTANNTSAGSAYIPINPAGHTYEYDYTISVNAGNQFYIGFERFDANKTSRSNSACTYTYATKPSANVVKQHFKGTVDLSTDGVNPCAFIALRILNGWSGTNSGVTGTATIHSFSLREIGTKQQPKLTKQGQFIEEELKEETNMKLHKNGIVETNNLIEI